MLSAREEALRVRLVQLRDQMVPSQRVPHDPVFFVHRYSEPADQELAGIFSSTLAYGRVSAFFAVLHPLFEHMDQFGGPDAFVRGFDEQAHGDGLSALRYRFNTGGDWVLLCQSLREVLAGGQKLGSVFSGRTGREAIETGVGKILAAAAELRGASISELPRGFRYWLPRPSSGSACKRWNLYLRWMVRPADGVDLGLWSHIDAATLTLPVDTHIHRVSGFLGLTDRKSANWRTADQITQRLARLDPADPVGFDFSLCHLGISGACHGHRVSRVCVSCTLDPFCTAPSEVP